MQASEPKRRTGGQTDADLSRVSLSSPLVLQASRPRSGGKEEGFRIRRHSSRANAPLTTVCVLVDIVRRVAFSERSFSA